MSIFKKEAGSNRPQPYSVGPLSMVPIKWNQYKNLTEAEKNNGTMYNITDKSFDKPDAIDIPYDGETSGSEETNVQDELDKLESVTGQINTDLSELITSGSVDGQSKTVAANNAVEWSMPLTVPNGYTPIGIVKVVPSSSTIVLNNFQILESSGTYTAYVYARNAGTASITSTCSVDVLYKKNL